MTIEFGDIKLYYFSPINGSRKCHLDTRRHYTVD